MERQLVNVTELRTPINFAKEKGVSKQNIYGLIGKKRFDVVK